MKINPDQPKKVVDRKVVLQVGGLSFELVKFELHAGFAWGCRSFTSESSIISELYDTEQEIREIIAEACLHAEGERLKPQQVNFLGEE